MAQKTATGKMRGRMRIVLFCFLIFGFAVIWGRLFLIQIVHGEEYQSDALQQQTRATTLGARRGAIYDRNGDVLVQSATVWNICISPAQIDEKKLPDIAENLSRILDVDKQVILDNASDRSVYYRRIKMRVDRGLADQVLEYTDKNKIDGVFLEEDTKRYYTYDNLASTVLGFTDYDNNGAYGLESYYDKILSGTPGMVVSAKNAWGSDMPFKYQQMYEAQDGNSIVLTIDQTIQHFLERNLETAIVEHSIGNRAAGIVMNVKTGEILAMATKPDFDPNDPYTLQDPVAVELLAELTEGTKEYEKTRKDLWYDQWRNKAISDPYEPGSVFKIITAASAIDNKVLSLDQQFFCSGSIVVSDRTIGCWRTQGHGAQNFIQGMQNSCNPVFIQVGQFIGPQKLHNYMENFGLNELTGIDLPGEAVGIMHSLETLDKPGKVELASTSFGQTFKVTPIQLITAVSAAVNGGDLMQPYIVKQVVDKDGNVLSTTQPVVRRQVISAQSSETMCTLVEAVVDGGSGRFAAIPGYRIGGKTGTSQKLDQTDGKHILSFVGFAPMDDPTYAVLILLDEPRLDDAYGSTIAAPVVGAVLQEMMPYLGYEPQYTAEELEEKELDVPYLIYQKPHDAQASLTNLGLKTRLVGNGPSVISQIPQAGQKIPRGGTVILYTEEEVLQSEITVPDLVGMDPQEANKIIVGAGLNIEIRGVTTSGLATEVVEQWPLAGETLATGEVVIITLAEVEPEPAEPAIAPETEALVMP